MRKLAKQPDEGVAPPTKAVESFGSRVHEELLSEDLFEGFTTEEREELRGLRREVRRLRQAASPAPTSTLIVTRTFTRASLRNGPSSSGWFDGVVPFAVEAVGVEVDGGEVCV